MFPFILDRMKRSSKNGAGSNPIGIPIIFQKTSSPMAKKQFLITC